MKIIPLPNFYKKQEKQRMSRREKKKKTPPVVDQTETATPEPSPQANMPTSEPLKAKVPSFNAIATAGILYA